MPSDDNSLRRRPRDVVGHRGSSSFTLSVLLDGRTGVGVKEGFVIGRCVNCVRRREAGHEDTVGTPRPYHPPSSFTPLVEMYHCHCRFPDVRRGRVVPSIWKRFTSKGNSK